MKKIRIFLISIFFVIPFYAYADLQATITTSPEIPSPYEPVTITISSYSFDVNTAMITWTVAGKKFISGMGIKKISIPSGGAGGVIPVRVKADTASGESVELSATIVPQSLDLVWETPESYVPLFYEGKSLPGEGATVKVVALPSMNEKGKQISPENLSYSWYVNDEYDDNASGYGRQSANFMLNYLDDRTDIKVRAESPNGSVAEKTTTIYPHEVMPLLYTYDYLFGSNFAQLLNRRLETTNDTVISLEPFYLSTKGALKNSVSYNWSLDGLPVTAQNDTLLALSPKSDSVGTRSLSVEVFNSKRILQKAEAALEIIFDTRN